MWLLSKKNEQNSITDYLTGLFNRRGFEEKTFAKWNEWVERQERILFLSIDLDKLKYINDTFGHKEGDKAICTAAKAIYDAVLNKGFAARPGGDEFEVIIEDAREDEVALFCKAVEKSLALANSENKFYQVSMSIGSYCKRLDVSDHYEECIRISDADMYRNKKNKR